MNVEKGKQYLFEYFDIKLSFNYGVSFFTKKIKFYAFIPNDFQYWDSDGFILLKIPSNLYTELDGLGNDFKIIRYYDKIKSRGKYKWNLLDEKMCGTKITDCPPLIDCSLNTHEHPQYRNWFIYENCGLTDKEYVKVDWQLWREYEQMMQYVDITLYYKLLVELTEQGMERLSINVNSFEEWKKIISYQYSLNNFFKIDMDLLEEYHISYLRDFTKTW